MSTIISKLEEIKSFVKDDEDYYISKENAEKMKTNAQTFLEKLGVIKNYINNLEIHDEEDEDDVTPVKKQSILSKLGNLIPSIYTKSKSESKSEIKYDDMEEARKKEEKEEADKKKRSERQQKREATDSEFVSLGTMFNTEEDDDQERKAVEEERQQREAEKERQRKAAVEAAAAKEERQRNTAAEEAAKAVLQKIKADQAQTEQNKTKANELLKRVQQDIDFEREFFNFQTNIQNASSIKNAEDTFQEAVDYYNKIIEDLDNLKVEANNIDITLKTIKEQIIKAINDKRSIIKAAYKTYGLQALKTDRIEELKLWNVDELNNNFKRIWGTDFKQEFEKDRWKALDTSKRKSLIQ